jgi:signal peptidase I
VGCEGKKLDLKWNTVRRSVLGSGLLICIFFFAFSRWVLWPVKISGDSMTPNYDDGQPNYIYRLAYLSHPPQRGDVVGVRFKNDEVCIKRVVGLPGEKIEFRRGTIVINGEPLVEPYPVKPLLWWIRSVQLRENEYFIMGDNRTSSMLWAVSKEQIIGKAVF